MPRKTLYPGAVVGIADAASMRPRPDAAENGGCRPVDARCGIAASMRPRPDAAENLNPAASTRIGTIGFNEAAARCRGKLFPVDLISSYDTRFNEAAARCRGKRRTGN